MEENEFFGKAWNNGEHHTTGAGYGIKLDAGDRDKYFDESWKTAVLHLEGVSKPVIANVDKPSFWGTVCKELIKQEIGIWLIDNEVAPWPKNNPPLISLKPLTDNEFEVKIV